MRTDFYRQFAEENLVVSTTDPVGTFTYVNERFCEISQYKSEELLNKKYQVIKSGYHPGDFFAAMWQTILEGKTWRGEVCNRAKDGSTFWVETFILPELTASGELIKFHTFGLLVTNRKEREEKLKTSENKLKAIFENSSGYHLFFGPDYKVLSFNKGSATISAQVTGKEIKEGASILDYEPEKILKDFKKHFQAALQGEEVTNEQEVNFIGAPFSRWFQITYSPVYDAANVLLGVSFNAIDIDPQKRAIENINAERKLFIGGPTVVFKWKAEDGWPVEYVSPNVESLFGYSQKDFMENKILYGDVIHSADQRRVKLEATRFGTEGLESYQQEYRIIRKDGQLQWVKDHIVVMRDKIGNIIHTIGYVNDITGWKQAEEKLINSEKRFRTLLENNDDAIVLLNEFGNLTYQSPAAEKILGYLAHEIHGKNGIEFYHPDDIPVFMERYDEALRNPGKPIFYPSRLRHKDGHYIWAEGTITNLYDDENIKAMVGNFRDITKRKEAEDKLRKQNEQLSEIARIQSHEIRGPVATLLGLTSLFNHTNPADPINEEIMVKILITSSKLDEVIHKIIVSANDMGVDKPLKK